MTRDHDGKRAIRARMKVTGERYTVARSALVGSTPAWLTGDRSVPGRDHDHSYS